MASKSWDNGKQLAGIHASELSTEEKSTAGSGESEDTRVS